MDNEEQRGALERSMRAPRSDFSTLARSLPDLPALVETRSMLLSGRCKVLLDLPDNVHFIVADQDSPLVSIVGKPQASLIQLAVSGEGGHPEVIARAESIEHVSHALPDWLGDEVIIHTRPDAEPSDRFQNAGSHELRLLGVEDHQLLGGLPEDLADELVPALLRGIPVAARFVGEHPVSFCYAAYETERYWDVSVDTVEAYRGRGFAGEVFTRMAGHLEANNKSPVWGALDSNLASLRVAEKLGFEAVDALALFRKREGA